MVKLWRMLTLLLLQIESVSRLALWCALYTQNIDNKLKSWCKNYVINVHYYLTRAMPYAMRTFWSDCWLLLPSVWYWASCNWALINCQVSSMAVDNLKDNLPMVKLNLLIIAIEVSCTIINWYISVQREWDGWAHKPGLTHLSLVRIPGPSVVLCVHYQ